MELKTRLSTFPSCRLALMILSILFFCTPKAQAFSLALDSVAEWGKFPRFCVNTYRWGDRFFNSYDTTYVRPTGYKFNVKLKADSWLDYYAFEFDNSTQMHMVSKPSTTLGVYLTYLAVSAGYDLNVSKYLGGGSDKIRRRFNFSFNCSLFAADLYFLSNDIGTRITRFGYNRNLEHLDLDFRGINNRSWGIDTYYFFNHKRYSQAAAFSYSRIQRRSAGSFYAGISYWMQKYNFNFSSLPVSMKIMLPNSWDNYHYQVKSNNYAVKLGYAYNWVFARNFVLGVSEAPTMGLRHGYINDASHVKSSFALYNKMKMSVIYNYRRMYTGVIGYHESGLVYDKEHTLLDMIMGVEIAVGYRFNIW